MVKDFFDSIGRELFTAIIGGIVGLLISVIFDDSIRNIKRKIVRKYKRLFSEKNDFKSHLFTIGDTSTSFFVIDGDGQFDFKRENIECRLTHEKIALPKELEAIRNEIATTEADKESKGLDHKWNGPLYGLAKYRHSRTSDKEDMTVLFNFYETDYFTFLASNLQLNRKLDTGKTVAETYIPYEQLENVVPFLANGFGVGLVIITSDENIIFSQRTGSSGARGNQMDISVVEGVHPILDRHSVNDGPDLFKTAVRGANEELGLIINPDIIKFLGYGIDVDYYQWNMLGYAHVPHTAMEIQNIRSRGTSGKWENSLLLFENFTPKNVAELIVTKDMWSTAKVALYWTAVRELGKNNIDRALKSVSKR
ncbi:hypothetical protein ACFFF5_21425 [Lederbergia wuyishanensis]|uniref:Nudix hydrolase domain-containing protein n=1 Tax=Lederbergia wuyishanensis TaxID=1347903 RepID=A0ABU0D354_9BACI|nr:hypothetical protein [Lederbergia wuyishanensis]MCJ8008000.1 hypothetical protein [Lederbergia wuyishanensis]MDQ0342829.1 hypothetical protein [Lederbergia wuyishanensis]